MVHKLKHICKCKYIIALLFENKKDIEEGHSPFLLTAEFRNPSPVTMAT